MIIQGNHFDGTVLVAIYAFTRNSINTPLFRLPVEPSVTNGTSVTSGIMVDKVTTVPRS